MSSSQDFSVYKTLPYNVYARAAGKWDYFQENQIYNSSQTVNISMADYDGLSMIAENQYLSALPLNFSETVLPWKWDYYNYLLTSKYCFMPTGQWYENVNVPELNATVVGSTIVIDTSWNVTGFKGGSISFGTASFLRVPQTFAPASGDTWEIYTNFVFKRTSSNRQRIFNTDLEYKGFDLLIDTNNHPILVMSSNGTSWNIANTTNTNYTFTADTEYWCKVEFTGTNYIISVSADNWSTSTQIFNIVNSNTMYQMDIRIGIAEGNSPSEPWQGSINIDKTYINVNGSSWWKGVDYAPVSRQGCTYNYTDDGSAVILNCFVVNNDETIVLTPDNSYTNGYLLGTVNIPSHDIYSYSETTTAWTQPVLLSAGTIGGDSFACYSPSRQLFNYDWYAFDGNSVSYWMSHTDSTPSNNYLEFYNPEAITVTNIAIKNYSSAFITDYEFQYSDDGIAWIIATSGTNTNTTSGGEWNFNVNGGGHKYWRIVAKQNGSVAIAEMTITAHTATGTWT